MRVNFVDLEIYEILLVFCTWEYPMHQWQLGSFGLAAGLSPMNEPSFFYLLQLDPSLFNS